MFTATGALSTNHAIECASKAGATPTGRAAVGARERWLYRVCRFVQSHLIMPPHTPHSLLVLGKSGDAALRLERPYLRTSTHSWTIRTLYLGLVGGMQIVS